MANRRFTSERVYTFHAMPVLLDCNFVVDSTNGNGLGIRSLKGPGIKQVLMHTSSTPAGVANPAAGYILVQLQDNYSRSFSGFSALVQPVSGTPLTATTLGLAYIIVSLGTATAAQWLAAGVPPGVTPAVGVSFIAKATGTIGGSAAVEVPATAGSNITNIETIGDPNLSLAPYSTNVNSVQGGWLLLRCMKNGAAQAPADGTVISLAFYLSNSSVILQGE